MDVRKRSRMISSGENGAVWVPAGGAGGEPELGIKSSLFSTSFPRSRAVQQSYPWWNLPLMLRVDNVKLDRELVDRWIQLHALAAKKMNDVHEYVANQKRPPFLQKERLTLENVICHVYQPFVDNVEEMNPIPVVLRARSHTAPHELMKYIHGQMNSALLKNARLFLYPLETFVGTPTENKMLEDFLHEAAGLRMQDINVDAIVKNVLLNKTAIRYNAASGMWQIDGDSCPRRLEVEGQNQETLEKVLAAMKYHELLHTTDAEQTSTAAIDLTSYKTRERQQKQRQKTIIQSATAAWLMQLFGLPPASMPMTDVIEGTPLFISMVALLDVVVPDTSREHRRYFARGIVGAMQACHCTPVGTSCQPNLTCFNEFIGSVQEDHPDFYKSLSEAGFNLLPPGDIIKPP